MMVLETDTLPTKKATLPNRAAPSVPFATADPLNPRCVPDKGCLGVRKESSKENLPAVPEGALHMDKRLAGVLSVLSESTLRQ